MTVCSDSTTVATLRATSPLQDGRAATFAASLSESFGVDFTVFDGQFGRVLYRADDQPWADGALLAELARQVATRRDVEVIADNDPLITLALPWIERGGLGMVAVATFVVREIQRDDDWGAIGANLGLDPSQAREWLIRQPKWPAGALERMGRLVIGKLASDERLDKLQDEVAALSINIGTTYEEISLLYRLTQNLKITGSNEQLIKLAMQWLSEAMPVKGLATLLPPSENGRSARESTSGESASHEAAFISYGECPLSAELFAEMIDDQQLAALRRPFVVNPPKTQQPDFDHPGVRQMIIVPLCEGENLFGYLAAFNHVDDEHFGSIEASLLSSVAAILGIHCGNIDLYCQRAELLTGVVRALTSAIDAKDPYTCGHSDRVARVSVRLAEQLGCDAETLNTLYLSGLLHDVGKIGIDDQVLRKPGKLTDAEYEHIKLHPEFGYKILIGLKELGEVLPVVLHHHENWDGTGYPHKLAGEAIPWLARIVAVADAFDAIGSDRPYRKGMADEKLDKIMHSGRGQQWDAQVIDAFFAVRDDLREISRREREAIQIDVQHWM